jgi:catechol 2,3-dioxygenase-like lactoylglutathione lyase family enzyme
VRKLPRVSAIWLGAAGLLAFHPPASAQTGFLNIVDHIHLAAPDQPKAVEWYRKHFGGQPMSEGTDRLMLGETRLIFQKNETPQPSAGSVLDHIGFSVPDVDATLRQFAADGVKVTTPPRDIPNLFKIAFVEDPWGTRIEVVQDSAKLGLHHVHLRAPDPAAALAWYVDKFGGKAGKLKGQIDGVQYSDVWLLVQRGETVPSAGHAIDHIGFRPLDIDRAVAGFKAKNVKVTNEPRPLTLPSGTSMHVAFIEGPDGVRIELVQR